MPPGRRGRMFAEPSRPPGAFFSWRFRRRTRGRWDRGRPCWGADHPLDGRMTVHALAARVPPQGRQCAHLVHHRVCPFVTPVVRIASAEWSRGGWTRRATDGPPAGRHRAPAAARSRGPVPSPWGRRGRTRRRVSRRWFVAPGVPALCLDQADQGVRHGRLRFAALLLVLRAGQPCGSSPGQPSPRTRGPSGGHRPHALRETATVIRKALSGWVSRRRDLGRGAVCRVPETLLLHRIF